MWFILLLYTAVPELLSAQGDGNKLILRKGNGPCEGHLQVYHSGEWGYVGDKYWNNSKTVEVVCRSTNCGEPVSSREILRPIGSKVWLNELRCNGSESHLWDCPHPGWGTSVFQKDTMMEVSCSRKDQIKMRLDRSTCAGAVQFSTDGENYSGYICADNWGTAEADMLCLGLGCGTTMEIPSAEIMTTTGFDSSAKMKIKCSNMEEVEHLWQCATAAGAQECSHPATVICTGHRRVRLQGNSPNVCQGRLQITGKGSEGWIPVNNLNTISPEVACNQMFCGTNASQITDDEGVQLNCTDNISVILKNQRMTRDGDKMCYGSVHIKVNETTRAVCASNWGRAEAEVVCRELKCGKVTETRKMTSDGQNGILDYVNCSGSELSLWHCKGKHGEQSKSFPCSSVAYVVCADSIDVRLKDGRGKCAGRVEIKYEGTWQRVREEGWTDTNSNAVCSQLKCGEGGTTGQKQFPQGSAAFLTKAVSCQPKAGHIAECITSDGNASPVGQSAVMLVCKGHKDVFLNGTVSCSGMVGIDSSTKTYWLSGSTETWNQESANAVCQQMNCGTARNLSSIPSKQMKKDIWDVAYKCSNNTTSLFDCEKTNVSSKQRNTVATVTCSESIVVNLTSDCWGHVSVCVGSRCGGVCKDSWSNSLSSMLCESLSCGRPIQHTTNQQYSQEVLITSLHTTTYTRSLSQSTMVLNNEGSCAKQPAYVICSGSIKVNIKPSRNQCSGKVEVYYEGQWLPVSQESLQSPATQNIICRELKCGQPLKIISFAGPQPGARVISDIQCPQNGSGIFEDCNSRVADPGEQISALGGLQCSDWRRMELKFGQVCRGAVFVYSEGRRSAVSAQNWTEAESIRLCQDLKCGNSRSNSTMDTTEPFWNTSFSCENISNANSIWDCETSLMASQDQRKQLFLECQGEPNVTLSEKCRGEVKINNRHVCSTNWNEKYSHLVCQEQQHCSNAVFYQSTTSSVNTQLPHVACEDHHDKLGQCDRYEGLCANGPVSVYCVGNIRFNTTERCGGQIRVNYRNKWENVCFREFPSQFREKLCQELGCQGYNANFRITSRYYESSPETMLNCSLDHNDIRHCVSHGSCEGDLPAQIYCYGYQNVPPRIEVRQTSIMQPVVGVGVFLFLLIFTAVIIICRKRKRFLSRISSKEEKDLSYHNYEDVWRRGGFAHHAPETKVATEGATQRDHSLIIDDDDDDVEETQPLTSEPTAVGVPGHRLDQSITDQDTDGVSYEVDDPRETYDDVEASSEMTQAEVHNIHGDTSEIFTRRPGHDEDYEKPGVDG